MVRYIRHKVSHIGSDPLIRYAVLKCECVVNCDLLILAQRKACVSQMWARNMARANRRNSLILARPAAYLSRLWPRNTTCDDRSKIR